MKTMNISMPDSMRAFVEEQVARGGYGTTSEYVRHLIRGALKHHAEERLERLLIEGLDSGEPIEVDDEYWNRLRDRLRQGARNHREPRR